MRNWRKKSSRPIHAQSGAGVSEQPISNEKLFPGDSSHAMDFFIYSDQPQDWVPSYETGHHIASLLGLYTHKDLSVCVILKDGYPNWVNIAPTQCWVNVTQKATQDKGLF